MIKKKAKVTKRSKKEKKSKLPIKITTKKMRNAAVISICSYANNARRGPITLEDALMMVGTILSVAKYDDIKNPGLNKHERYKEFYFKAQ